LVTSYEHTPRNVPEERRPHLQRDGRLKSNGNDFEGSSSGLSDISYPGIRLERLRKFTKKPAKIAGDCAKIRTGNLQNTNKHRCGHTNLLKSL
jgi:hypothetical protein